MLYEMINELSRFFSTFGLMMCIYWIVGRMLGTQFKKGDSSFF